MKQILMIGLGKFGRHMAKTFLENGHQVLGIDHCTERADAAVDFMQQIMIGDVTDERFMGSIGVKNFDLAVVAIGENFQTVLEVTVLLKDLGCPYIVARATSDVHKKLLLRNGADYVCYAEKEMAERLAIKFGADNIFDYVELTPEIGIYEIAVPKEWKGKNMIELSIRNRYHVSVLALKVDGKIQPLPLPTHVFGDEESVMVMGAQDAIDEIT